MAQQAQGAQYEVRPQQQPLHQSRAAPQKQPDAEMEAAKRFEEACRDDQEAQAMVEQEAALKRPQQQRSPQ